MVCRCKLYEDMNQVNRIDSARVEWNENGRKSDVTTQLKSILFGSSDGYIDCTVQPIVLYVVLAHSQATGENTREAPEIRLETIKFNEPNGAKLILRKTK